MVKTWEFTRSSWSDDVKNPNGRKCVDDKWVEGKGSPNARPKGKTVRPWQSWFVWRVVLNLQRMATFCWNSLALIP